MVNLRSYCSRTASLASLGQSKPRPTSSYSFSRLLNTPSEPALRQNTVIFSGIQPTGVPHIGNYLGALKQWVELQNEAPENTSLLFCIVDLHSLTSLTSSAERRQYSKSMLAALLAVGLNPKRSSLFYQSSVPAHSELHWILSCDASMGWLSRMTQWKNKLSDEETVSLTKRSGDPNSGERMKLGLFSYPVLQAADILLYKSTHIPVGEDQLQHVEFARECAQRFNFVHGAGRDILTLPTPILSPFKRVMSLQEPKRKMSKSHINPKSRILLTDTADEIAKKFRVALTDSVRGISCDRDNRPGVFNILEMISLFDKQYHSTQDVAEDFKDLSLQALKEKAAYLVSQHLAPITQEYNRLLRPGNEFELAEIAAKGRAQAIAYANDTMTLVREAVGIESSDYF